MASGKTTSEIIDIVPYSRSQFIDAIAVVVAIIVYAGFIFVSLIQIIKRYNQNKKW